MEATVIINGHELTEGQSMTLRVAVNSFVEDLKINGLGDDEHGKAMTEAYRDRLVEIQRMIAR